MMWSIKAIEDHRGNEIRHTAAAENHRFDREKKKCPLVVGAVEFGRSFLVLYGD